MPGFAWRMSLLKFYPFRLFDGVMPIAAAFAVVQIWHAAGYRWLSRHSTAAHASSDDARSSTATGQNSTYVVAGTFVCAALWCASLILSQQTAHPSRMSAEQFAAWQEVCRWIEARTPSDSLLITPNQSWGFKWYAGRAEFVNIKDCPQDAPHLVEWNRRLKLLARWGERHFSGGYSQQELQSLQQQTGADYLLAQHLGPINIEPVYRNEWYRLYVLPRDGD